MKDALSKTAVDRIAGCLTKIYPTFNSKRFCLTASAGLELLELKARVNHIVLALGQELPDFAIIADTLCLLPQQWNNGNSSNPYSGFTAWPIIDYVSVFGIEHPVLAFKTLEKLTPLFSAEFAIRPFIEKYPDAAFQQLIEWAKHEDKHVRRLASEGCRPRLPWGSQLKTLIKDPNPIFPILELLKRDTSIYVQKSVANNLNDITKDNPDLVLSLCEQWQQDATQETQWIIKHACRSLVKAGDKRCLMLLGVGHANIAYANLECPTSINQEDSLSFSFSMLSQQNQKLVIDFAIDFVRSRGKLNRKVFKLKTLNTKENEWVRLNKAYSFKTISTRKYHPGIHHLHIQVNGEIVASSIFDLINVEHASI
jgi:3-methyladenine DNA glycosylase AlkC